MKNKDQDLSDRVSQGFEKVISHFNQLNDRLSVLENESKQANEKYQSLTKNFNSLDRNYGTLRKDVSEFRDEAKRLGKRVSKQGGVLNLISGFCLVLLTAILVRGAEIIDWTLYKIQG
ncbi:MAG: hypothetical protein OXC61_11285 [Flavobacteriaceae bacterium]|nr:hypothetical protein [Flavobacteriaceae bacterium]